MRRTGSLTLLVLALFGLAAPCARGADVPFCELYAAGHFGNWYEVAGVNEMRRVLNESKHWGFNRYADWFDATDCVDPFSGDPQYSLGNALWDLKRIHFRTAQSLGLATDLAFSPNHVYRDQLKPEWLAKRGPRTPRPLNAPPPPPPGGRLPSLSRPTTFTAISSSRSGWQSAARASRASSSARTSPARGRRSSRTIRNSFPTRSEE